MNSLEKLKALTGVLLCPVVSRPSKSQRCFRDGRWQVDELANLSEKLEREISAIEDAVNASGTAIGDENSHYTTAERIRDITAQRDYFMRECDKYKLIAEKAIAELETCNDLLKARTLLHPLTRHQSERKQTMKTAEEWQSEFVTNPEWGTYANMPHFVRAIQLDAMKKKQ